MPKNIVICLDGTGNQIEENLSNVLKLYRALKKNKDQVVFYDQGVGTLKQEYTWGRSLQKARSVIGLAFGLGIDKNVLRAYTFLVENYAEQKVKRNGKPKTVRDKIYIFGFSRGAHTARVLAAMIYEIGILRPDQVHLAGAALTAYKKCKKPKTGNGDTGLPDKADYEGSGPNFRRVTGTRTGSVQFLGLWDSVSSVIIPNPHGLLPPVTLEKLLHTSNNPAIAVFRQAGAIDERRRMFRLDAWEPGQMFKPSPYITGDLEPQDAQQVWFAGVHSDIGGGYKRADSGISQFPLIWMIDEARLFGLKLDERMVKYVTGIKAWSSNTEYLYPKPDVGAPVHNSLTLGWAPLEIIPKAKKLREWPKRPAFLGCYIPWAEPRFIPEDAELHPSVIERLKTIPGYNPPNIPDRYKPGA